LVADRQPDVLLQRRARAKAGVVPGAKQARAAEGREVIAERGRGRSQVLLVARAMGLEPLAVVVVLELAQELDRLGREALERRHGRMMPAVTRRRAVAASPTPLGGVTAVKHYPARNGLSPSSSTARRR